jgi:hypothetical protein
MIDDECGAVNGIRIRRGYRSTRRKPAPAPLCPPQIPHDLNWARTRVAVVGSRRLTAWAMARTLLVVTICKSSINPITDVNTVYSQSVTILSQFGITLDGVLDWILDLLTTYTRDSELQTNTAPPLIFRIHKSPQYSLSLFQPAVSSPAVTL